MKTRILMMIMLLSLTLCVCAQTTDIINVINCDAAGYTTVLDQYFTIRGIVTTVNLDPSRLSFYVQDATAGVLIDKSASAGFYTNKGLAVGSDVTITGKVFFYNGLVELTPDAEADITNNGTGTVPTPVAITIDDLQNLTADNQARFNMRGKLVKIDNVYLATGSAAWPASGSNANLTIAIGAAANTPTGSMRIDKDTDCDENTEPVWPQNVTGVLTQFDSSTPYYDDFQISPMSFAGFEAYATVDNWDLY